MKQMVATYERNKTLNVRESPSPSAKVVRVMRPGDQVVVEEIREGWARLADGFAQVAYLVVRLGDALAENVDAVAEAKEAPEATGPEPEPDEAAELRKMTNQQLYTLAEQSGIKVKKGANKQELIDAILADA